MIMTQEKDKIRVDNNILAFETNYWIITERILTNTNIGKKTQHDKRMRENIRDEIIKGLGLEGCTEMVYTDGSKKEGRTGIYKEDGEKEISLAINNEATICTAELIAIYEAIDIVQREVEIKGTEKKLRSSHYVSQSPSLLTRSTLVS